MRARRVCRRLFNVFYRRHVLPRIAVPSEAWLLGRRFVTHPDVFHPVFFLSTRMLADHFARIDLAGRRFLDMGTGSGAVGVFAAARGARVTACDINPRAVAVARENARENGVEMEVLESHLYAALPGRAFDVICFNIPFYPKPPETPLGHAFNAGPDFQTVRAFAEGTPRHLAADGVATIVFSEDSGYDRIVSFFTAAGLEPAEIRRLRKHFEEFFIVSFRHAPSRRGRGAPGAASSRPGLD